MARHEGMVSTPRSSDEKDPYVDHVSSEFERYESFHRDRFEEDRAIQDLWENKELERGHDWMNAVAVPLMLEAEQTVTPRLFTALFPTDAPLDVHVEGDAPQGQGIQIKGLLQHYFRVTDVQGEALPMLTQTTLFGTGYMEGGSWLVKKQWIETPAQPVAPGEPLPKPDMNYVTTEARPTCRAINYFELFPHPAKRKMDDGLAIIRKYTIDAEALKTLATDSNWPGKKIKDALDSTPPHPVGDTYNPKKEREYEILEYWGPWDEQIHKEEKVITRKAVPYWIIVVNRKVCVRSIPNPYNHQSPPYIRTKLYESPDPSWFGVGVGKAGKPTADRVNKIVNQRLDNVDLVLNKQGFYNGNDPLINKTKLQVSKPGKWHKVSDTVTSIRWMDTPDVTTSSYKEEELAKQDFREATGANQALMPGPKEDTHRTAMGIQLLQGTAGARFRPVLRKMEIDFIQQIAMFYFSNLKQFMTEAQWVEITGKSGRVQPIRITPEQIQAKVFFIPTGVSETVNKEVQVGQLLRFKEITMNDPTVNRTEINKRVAELMGFKDIEKLLVPQKMGQVGGLGVEEQMRIQQRVAEGADPRQIAEEMAGGMPQPPAQVPGMMQ